MLNKFENYIFDLDGTIVDSSNEILKCLKKAFQAANIAVEEERLNSDIIGPPIHQIIKSVCKNIDETSLKSVIYEFRQLYDYDTNDVSFLYEGIFETLEMLKKSNKRLFIATFKPHVPTLRLIKYLNLNMFETFYTVDYPANFSTKSEIVNALISKCKLARNKTLMVGDASSDMMAAKENGILGIGALWGYGYDKTFLKANADLIVESINDLKSQIIMD